MCLFCIFCNTVCLSIKIYREIMLFKRKPLSLFFTHSKTHVECFFPWHMMKSATLFFVNTEDVWGFSTVLWQLGRKSCFLVAPADATDDGAVLLRPWPP